MADHEHHHAQPTADSYRPLWLVLGGILAAAVATMALRQNFNGTEPMRWVMGYFFLVFGLFKAWRWKEFANVFREYDLIAKHFPVYGYAYPAIEILLGKAYLASIFIVPASWVAFILLSIGAVGVFRAIRGPKKYRCACLGAVINLPLSTVSLVEDVGMGLMAAGMLLLNSIH